MSLFAVPVLAANDQVPSGARDQVMDEPYRFPAEFTIQQAYLGGANVERGECSVNDFDQYYSNLIFVGTPRARFGILRLGAFPSRRRPLSLESGAPFGAITLSGVF